MAHLQEDGWPLGLDRLNVRIGLVRNGDYSGSVSFSTLLTTSSSSASRSDSSSDLDTQSSASFFHDRSINLGSLVRASSILHLSRRSTKARTVTVESTKSKKNIGKPLTCLYLLCSKTCSDDTSVNNAPTLGCFLEEERRASAIYRN